MEASTLQAPVVLSRISVAAPLLRLRSDEQLVILFRAGSDDAFRAIHDRYRARLLAYAGQMLGGSRHDAEDALQDVFVRAYAALRTSDRPISLRAWLYRVAHNRCIDQLRRPVPDPCDVFDLSRPPTHDPPLETERREELRRLVIDVGRLPDQQRSALLMREVQGMSYEEMAQALDVSVAAIKSLLVRARGGLVDSAHARDTACTAVRREVALACDRGVRGSGLVRRHLRDCSGCREYRDRLRGARRRLAALAPVGPLGVLAQAVGLGGTGGAAVAGVGGVGTLGGAGAILTATKVALVCAAAVTAGAGALEVAHRDLRHASSSSGDRSPAVAHHDAATLPVPGFAGASVTVRAPGAPLAPLAPLTLGGARPPGASAPAPAKHAHHPPAVTPQFITGQDVYPLAPDQSTSTGGDPSSQSPSGGGTSVNGAKGGSDAGLGSGTTTATQGSGTGSPSGSTTGAGSSGAAAGATGQKTSPGGSGTVTTGSQGSPSPSGGAPQAQGSSAAGSPPPANSSSAPAGNAGGGPPPGSPSGA